MPIYEYRCTDCDNDFEALVRSMVQTETIQCPTCGSTHVKKAISLFGAATGGSRTGGATTSTAGASCGPVG